MLLLLACTSATPDDTDKTDSGTDTADTGETADTGDSGGTTIDDEAVAAAVREAVEKDIDGSSATGAQVCVWRAGEVIFSEGFGTVDEAETQPTTTTTLFQIGSDTKKITAIALLQAVERGEITLDTTVAEAIPGLSLTKSPDWAATTTIHELISHQGGLYDYTPWSDAPADSELYDRAFGLFAENEWAMIPSGTAWNYANPNFSIAGLALEQATGRAYGDVINDDVFAALGMTRTFARRDEAVAAGEGASGRGYTFTGGGDPFNMLGDPGTYTFGWVTPEAQADDAFTRPAGMVWSTAEDQCKLGAFLVDGDPAVLGDASRELISTGHVPLYPGLEEQQYGYGLMVLTGWQASRKDYYETPLWQHGGNTLSMTSTFFVLPEQRLVVSILSNGYGDDMSKTVMAALEGFVPLPEPVEPPSLLDPEDDPAHLAGTYADPWGFGTVTLTWDGSQMLVDAPDLKAAGVDVGEVATVAAKDLLYIAINGTTYDFSAYADDSGTTTWLVNRMDSLTRVEGAEGPPARRKAVAPVRFAPRTW